VIKRRPMEHSEELGCKYLNCTDEHSFWLTEKEKLHQDFIASI